MILLGLSSSVGDLSSLVLTFSPSVSSSCIINRFVGNVSIPFEGMGNGEVHKGHGSSCFTFLLQYCSRHFRQNEWVHGSALGSLSELLKNS